MNVRQLEELIGSSDQRVFHILTVTHLYGGIAGTVSGAWLLQPFLGVWGFLLGGALGLVSTYKRRGRPLFGWVFAYVRFMLRRLFKMGDTHVDAAQYYATHRVRSDPYMVMGADGAVVMVNRGSRGSGGSEAKDDPMDRMIILPGLTGLPGLPGLTASRSTGKNTLNSTLPDDISRPLGFSAHSAITTARGRAISIDARLEASTSAPRSRVDTDTDTYTEREGYSSEHASELSEHIDRATSPRHKETDLEAWGLN